MDILEKLSTQIKEMDLTKNDRAVAAYFLENSNTIGLYTSTTLAENIGVSDTAIIRFVKKLGFHTYSEFREAMNQRMAQNYADMENGPTMWEKYVSTQKSIKESSLTQQLLEQHLENLQSSAAAAKDESVQQAAEILKKSRRKFIAGFRGSACCSLYMSTMLRQLVPSVECLDHAGSDAIERMYEIDSRDCLLLYTFPRYSEITSLLVEYAGKKGAKIILVTDSLTCPLAKAADVVLLAKVKGPGFLNSYVVPIGLSELLLLTLSRMVDEKRMKELGTIELDNGLY